MRNPEDFKNPDLFRTHWPIEDSLQKLKYDEGLKMSRDAFSNGGAIHITDQGVWSARWPNTTVQSYEKIGYHAGTCHFLRGLLDGPAPIWVFPQLGDGVKIKEAGLVDEHEACDAANQIQFAKVKEALLAGGFVMHPSLPDVFVSPVTYVDGEHIKIQFANNTFRIELEPDSTSYLSAYSLRADSKYVISDDITPTGAWRLVSFTAMQLLRSITMSRSRHARKKRGTRRPLPRATQAGLLRRKFTTYKWLIRRRDEDRVFEYIEDNIDSIIDDAIDADEVCDISCSGILMHSHNADMRVFYFTITANKMRARPYVNMVVRFMGRPPDTEEPGG